MTLDRTKKYKVGDVVFHILSSTNNQWRGKTPGGADVDTTSEGLLALHPVEVEEPLKWWFDSGQNSDIRKRWRDCAPDETFVGNWRHEVVSTRIG